MSGKTGRKNPDIPDQSWTNPFPEGHPIHDLYGRRVRNEQDLIILIDDYHARRGTGKSVASLQMAEGMDQNGGLQWENVTLRPDKLRNAYAALPERSALVFDEGEMGASNRDSQTKTNKALREIMSIGRVEQKYLVINTPDIGFLDKDIRKLADVWMTMLTKGLALIHHIRRNPYSNGSQMLTEVNGLIEFDDIQPNTRLREVYNRATREKRKHIDGEEGDGLMAESEHKEKLRKAKKQARKDARNEVLQDVYQRLSGMSEEDMDRIKKRKSVSQAMLGEAVGLTQQQVGNIVRQ